jgi:hypothetical protein
LDAVAGFGIVAGIATFAGIGLAIYYGRREGSRQKILGYEGSISPIPVASSASLESYDLEVVFKPRGQPPRNIDTAFAHYLRFANFGREPIRREDFAPANPLRVVVDGTEVLDARVEATRRDVNRIELGRITAEESSASIAVTFDFLDYLDGAVVRLLTTSRPNSVEMAGDIIGMPGGIKTTSELRGRRSLWGPLGVVLAILFEVATLALCVFAFHWIVGEWGTAWILILPIVALIAPFLISLFVGDTVWPKPGPHFPAELRRRLPFGRYPMPHDTMVYIDERYGPIEASVEHVERPRTDTRK